MTDSGCDSDGTTDSSDGKTDSPTNWLVQGPAVASGEVAAELLHDPGMLLVKHIGRDILLLEMTPALAERLKTRFGPALIVEQDQPLTHFDP
jgi:hypothetical protein